ncbi:MAG: HNH endonuclease signature motif containing protein [Pseudomonadota bacterium]
MASVNKVIIVGGSKAIPKDALQRLLSKTEPAPGGCMLYTGCVQSNGYARATVNRKTDYAHRHVYRLAKGPIPKGMDVCHSCDMRRCISSDHLFLGTRLDNMRDAVRKGRQAKGNRLPNAKLSPSVVRAARLASALGASTREIALAADVERSTMRSALKGHTWRHA